MYLLHTQNNTDLNENDYFYNIITNKFDIVQYVHQNNIITGYSSIYVPKNMIVKIDIHLIYEKYINETDNIYYYNSNLNLIMKSEYKYINDKVKYIYATTNKEIIDTLNIIPTVFILNKLNRNKLNIKNKDLKRILK